MNPINEFRAGAARVAVVLPDSFYPYRGIRGRLLTGQHDPLHVRTIVLEASGVRSVQVSFELGDLGEIDLWLDRVSAWSGAARDHIQMSVVHTHEAPHMSDDYNQPVADVEKTADFGTYVLAAAEASVRQAASALRPAVVGHGQGACFINVNRNELVGGRYTHGRDPHGPSDKTVEVLRIDSTDGDPIAVFINYAVHGVVMFDAAVKDGGMLVSADLPGACSLYVEERLPGAVALWTSGAAGDQNPMLMAKRPVAQADGTTVMVDGGAAGYLLQDQLGETLGREVLRVRSLTPALVPNRIAGAHRISFMAGQVKAQKPFDIPDGYQYADGEPVKLHMSLVALGPVLLLGVPGELVTSYGDMLKTALVGRPVIVVTHCNGSISYMADDLGFQRRTFEALVSHVRRGAAGPALLAAALDLVDRVAGFGSTPRLT